MIAQSYSLQPSLQTPIGPDYLILNTSDLVTSLRKKLEPTDADEKEILNSIFQSLMYSKNAHLELEYSCYYILNQMFGYNGECIHEPGVRPIIAELEKFGIELLEQLQRLNAYRNGYLFYQYMQMLGADIVLVRLVPPELNVR